MTEKQIRKLTDDIDSILIEWFQTDDENATNAAHKIALHVAAFIEKGGKLEMKKGQEIFKRLLKEWKDPTASAYEYFEDYAGGSDKYINERIVDMLIEEMESTTDAAQCPKCNGQGYVVNPNNEYWPPYGRDQCDCQDSAGAAEGTRQAVNHWIDVSTPPAESGRYWCYVKQVTDFGFGYYHWNCYYDNLEQVWRGGGVGDCGDRVTHWMPLPEDPIQNK